MKVVLYTPYSIEECVERLKESIQNLGLFPPVWRDGSKAFRGRVGKTGFSLEVNRWDLQGAVRPAKAHLYQSSLGEGIEIEVSFSFAPVIWLMLVIASAFIVGTTIAGMVDAVNGGRLLTERVIIPVVVIISYLCIVIKLGLWQERNDPPKIIDFLKKTLDAIEIKKDECG